MPTATATKPQPAIAGYACPECEGRLAIPEIGGLRVWMCQSCDYMSSLAPPRPVAGQGETSALVEALAKLLEIREAQVIELAVSAGAGEGDATADACAAVRDELGVCGRVYAQMMIARMRLAMLQSPGHGDTGDDLGGEEADHV